MDDACDICIRDWEGDELMLLVDEAHTVRMLRPESEEVGDTGTLVPDFVALSFGNTTFCVGPTDAAWPSDLDLLNGMLMRTKEEVARPSPAKRSSLKFTGIVLASTMATSAVIAGAIVAGTQPSEAVSPAPNLDRLAMQLSGSLHAVGLRELHAKAAGNIVLVQGMVPSAQEDIAARKLISRIGGEHAQRGYDVAQEDVRSMQESLGTPSTNVAYIGNGVFRITGAVPSLESFHQALTGIREDFDSNVRKIEADVHENAAVATPENYSAVVSTGDVRYIETSDGVKHVYPAGSGSID